MKNPGVRVFLQYQERLVRILFGGPSWRGEHSRSAPSGGDSANLHYSRSKEFLEAGKRRLMSDTKHQATSGKVVSLRKENNQLKYLP